MKHDDIDDTMTLAKDIVTTRAKVVQFTAENIMEGFPPMGPFPDGGIRIYKNIGGNRVAYLSPVVKPGWGQTLEPENEDWSLKIYTFESYEDWRDHAVEAMSNMEKNLLPNLKNAKYN